MKSLTFEYGGFHFIPFMKLTGRAGDFDTMAMAYNYKTPLLAQNSFSHTDFLRCVTYKSKLSMLMGIKRYTMKDVYEKTGLTRKVI